MGMWKCAWRALWEIPKCSNSSCYKKTQEGESSELFGKRRVHRVTVSFLTSPVEEGWGCFTSSLGTLGEQLMQIGSACNRGDLIGLASGLIGFPGGASGNESACQCRRHRFQHWVRKIPWRRKWLPTLVFLLGKSHGRRSLEGYSPWGLKELDMTEQLSTQWLINLTLYHSEQGKRELEDSKAEKGT